MAVANSYTQFVPGHTHLKPVGEVVAEAVYAAGGVPREFNEELAERRERLEASTGYRPTNRDRAVSDALRAYAAMATSADTGAVRDVRLVEAVRTTESHCS